MAMRQARRIAQDIAEANTLPKIRVSCMHERMDLLFAHIGLEDPRGCSLLRMPLLIQLNPDYPCQHPMLASRSTLTTTWARRTTSRRAIWQGAWLSA